MDETASGGHWFAELDFFLVWHVCPTCDVAMPRFDLGDERFVVILKSAASIKSLSLDLTDEKCVIFTNSDGAAVEWNMQRRMQAQGL